MEWSLVFGVLVQQWFVGKAIPTVDTSLSLKSKRKINPRVRLFLHKIILISPKFRNIFFCHCHVKQLPFLWGA